MHQTHTLADTVSARDALRRLEEVPGPKTLFVLNADERLVGTLTDGDIRRGLIRGLDVDGPITTFMFAGFSFLSSANHNPAEIARLRADDIRLVPLVDEQMRLLRVIDLVRTRALLPLDAVIMAGGRGERLKPLTDSVPKPLLPVGGKPIIEHNIDRLAAYGLTNITISIRYLGQQLIDHFGDGASRKLNIAYVSEDKPLGTFGAIKLVQNLHHDVVLVMNSDLLTDIDFEDFYNAFISQGADMAIATVPYKVNVPYAVLEVDGTAGIRSFTEKPTYTYYSNAGIYLLRRELLDRVPTNQHYNATDLMEDLIADGRRVVSYPMLGYWLDIGKHDDYRKAQEDIRHLKL